MSRSFTNQVAVITGASSGIGWELARALAREGCKVGLIARRRDLLEKLADVIARAGGTVATAVADVGEREQVHAAIRAIEGQLGPTELLVANAGYGVGTAVDPINAADVEGMMRVNFLGVVYAIETVLPGMLRRGRGHLAAVSSLGAYKGMPGSSAYSASKAAINTYLEGIRVQLRARSIAVTTICPGFIRTPMTAVNPFKMPWLMEPEEAARRIVRALHRRKKVYNFPWQTTLLLKLACWLPDWLLARGMRRIGEKPLPPAPQR